MRAYGKRKTRTPIAGHQDCGVCHGDAKIGAARERQAARRELSAVAHHFECGVDGICDACAAPPPRLGAWVYDENMPDWVYSAIVDESLEGRMAARGLTTDDCPELFE